MERVEIIRASANAPLGRMALLLCLRCLTPQCCCRCVALPSNPADQRHETYRRMGGGSWPRSLNGSSALGGGHEGFGAAPPAGCELPGGGCSFEGAPGEANISNSALQNGQGYHLFCSAKAFGGFCTCSRCILKLQDDALPAARRGACGSSNGLAEPAAGGELLTAAISPLE